MRMLNIFLYFFLNPCRRVYGERWCKSQKIGELHLFDAIHLKQFGKVELQNKI